MNSIKYTFAPVQKFFAVVAIFALVAMPMAQVFAQEALADEPVVQEQSAPAEQEAPAETPEQKTEEQSDDAQAELTGDRYCGTDIENHNCPPPPPKPVTIVAEKIVCTEEKDVPNSSDWVALKPIDADTASDWLEGHKSCKLASGWDFEWVKVENEPASSDVNTVPQGAPWTLFSSPTDSSGKTSVTFNDLGKDDRVWFREVLKDNYIPFTHESDPTNSNHFTAGFYCNDDVKNYDNLEWIEKMKKGETYHCVAWNVPEKGSITIEKEIVGEATGWSFDFTGSQGEFALTEGAGSSKTFSDLTPGEYTFDELDEEGWDLTNVTCDDVRPTTVQTDTPKPASDLVVDLDPGENVTCTFTNTKEVPQTPVCQTEANLLKNGSFEMKEVTNGSKWQQFDYLVDSIDWVVKKVSDSSNALLEFHRGWNGNVAADKEQYVELDGNQPTRISQDVVTEKGATYKLSWAFAPRQDTVAAENNLGIEVEGVQVDTEGPAVGVGVLTLEKWTSGEYEFVAGDASTEIAFKDLGPESVGGGSDVGTFLDDACLIKVKDAPKVCEVTLVSGTDANVDGSDDNTTVVEKSGALAKLLAPIHTAWTAAITGASWIWGDNPVAAPVDGVTQTFVRKFGWGGDTVTDVKLYVAADNSYVATLNGDAAGLDAGEFNYNLAGQDMHPLANTIVDAGNNILSINVVNKPSSADPAANPAGLMYKLVITGTGENCEVPYDDEPEVPVCSSFVSDDYDVNRGQDFNLSWAFGGDVDYVEIDGIEGTFGPSASEETSIKTDTEFLLTAYAEGEGEDEKLFTCSLDVDTHSSGGGGHSSSKKKGSVLGDSEDRPEGGVAGASTEMPAGAPNTGAGGTSPLVVSLPSLTAVLGSRTSVRKN